MSILLAAAVLMPVLAYNPPTDSSGPLTVRIDGPQEIARTGVALPVKVTLENSGPAELRGTLRLGVIDRWTVTPATVQFQLDAKGSRVYGFEVTAAPGSYNAHYPIHAFVEAGGIAAHAVLVARTQFPDAPRAKVPIHWQPLEVAPASELSLWRVPVRRVVLQVFGKDTRTMPVGWDGTDAATHAVAIFAMTVTRGETRQAINLHEPYAQGPGTILAEYPLALPRAPSIKLTFANAVRDDAPGQAPGDGVTFRVRVLPLDAPEGKQGEVVFERNTAAKTWQPGEADLTRFAGQRIRLQLESNPGPRNNTTNDSSYWSEPKLVLGPPTIRVGRGHPDAKLGSVQIYLGPRGLLDGAIQIGSLWFQGFQVRVLGDALEESHSSNTVLTGIETAGSDATHLRVRHSFRSWAGTFDVVGELWMEGEALHVHWLLEKAPAAKPWLAVYLESVGAGPWGQTAERVYAGDGNVLLRPGAFTLPFDGHRLSTSYAGFDFASGASMLEAVDVPPTSLDVDPKTHTYSLRAEHEQTMTFIPAANVWDAVRVWHEINGLHAAGGVQKLGGRFVFDLWGGNFTTSAAALEQAFHYGLTDAMVVWHNWQRWGYDYRLPEIFPPNPKVGTIEQMAAVVALCKKNGVLFGPHDNYIDFYPDAKDFSYDRIAFSANGAPVKAWFNKGRDAQSYRWRADLLQAPMEANVTALRDHVAPTGYFIDVWSSAGPYDYWTRDGVFHDKLSTRKVWADTFNWIRETLGDDAPTISESGHDQLIGALDGGQTNHLRVDTPPAGEMNWTVWNIKVADAERIPWYDAAHHDRFILHGAGYENRYAGGLDTAMHGIYSDDYITTEVLDGHPAMVPSPFGRDVVRKYWLLHDLMRALALKRLESHEFVGGDLHRQHVKWQGGAEVWVNRGATDWSNGGHTLPQYGFYAQAPLGKGVTEAAIERRDGVIVEWSRSPEASYSNARPYVTDRLPVQVAVNGIEDLGGHKFRLTLNWTCSGPIPDGYRILVHFTDAAGEILFQGDHKGPGESSQWKGTFSTSTVVNIPESIKVGTRFEMRVGLYGTNLPRAQLLGLSDDQRRLRLGAMEWGASGISWKPIEGPPDPFLSRFNMDKRPITFGGVTTTGAVRVSQDGTGMLVTPLPGGGAFEIRLRVGQAPRTVQVLDEGRNVVTVAPAQVDKGVVVIRREPTVFAYRVR
jgi:hypothetical protein